MTPATTDTQDDKQQVHRFPFHTRPVDPMFEYIQRPPQPRMTEEDRDRLLRDLPPSAKLVYKALRHGHAMTSKEISDETLLAARTVRHALKRLRQFALVNSRASLKDCRTAYFFVGDQCDRV